MHYHRGRMVTRKNLEQLLKKASLERGLFQRLKGKQGKEMRNSFFQNYIKENNFDKLKFICFVTHDRKDHANLKNELPILSESIFLQQFLREFGKLPYLNKRA